MRFSKGQGVMMYLPTNSWPKTGNARKGLLIAQTARSLLRWSAFESFRLQSLDLISRLKEVEKCCREVEKGLVSPKTLIDPVRELATSLLSDPVAKGIFGNDMDEYINLFYKFESSSIDKIRSLSNSARYIYQILAKYYKIRLENEIIGLFDEEGNESRVKYLLNAYLSYIINRGYSRQYVNSRLEQVFFSKDIKRFDKNKFREFFRSFSFKDRNFTIWIPIYGAAKSFIKHIDLRSYRSLSFHQLPQSLQSIINNNAGFSDQDEYISVSMNEKDAWKAAESANLVLRIFRSVTVLNNTGYNLKSRSYIFVVDNQSHILISVPNENFSVQRIEPTITQRGAIRIRDAARKVFGNFQTDSTQRIISSAESVLLAKGAASAESQLVQIWSAAEVLLGDPPDDSSRISYYSTKLSSCICLNYAWRYTKAVADEIQKHGRNHFNDIIDSSGIDKSVSSHTQTIALLFDDKINIHLNKFVNSLSFNPGLTNLVVETVERFGTPEALLNSYRDHERRVMWQICRIYRARNEFIHTGRSPQFTEGFARNCYEYYGTALQAILHVSDRIKERTTLDVIIDSMQLAFDAKKGRLEKLRKIKGGGSEARFLAHFDRH